MLRIAGADPPFLRVLILCVSSYGDIAPAAVQYVRLQYSLPLRDIQARG